MTCKILTAYLWMIFYLPAPFSTLYAAPLNQDPHAVSIIYIESNTGDSSGGHAAMKAGRDVFHFQRSDHGILLLKRDQWNFFRFHYNDLGNRDMHIVHLDLSQEATLKIWTHFTSFLLRQEAWLSGLRARERDVELLRALKTGAATFDVRGAGFFLTGNNSALPQSVCLKQYISLEFGPDFLSSRIRTCRDHLRQLPGITAEQNMAALPGAMPLPCNSSLAAYRERLSNLAALEILDECRGLRQDALIQMPVDPANPCLTYAEKEELVRWGDMFKKSISYLLKSRRPDYGFAIMLATARYLSIQESLRQGRLVMLDSFPNDADIVDAIEEAGSVELLKTLASNEKKRFMHTRSWLFQSKQRNELKWSLFENKAACCAELCTCAAGKSHMRVYFGTAVPSHYGPVRLMQREDIKGLAEMLDTAVENLRKHREYMGKQWSYNLLTRNCVTELFQMIGQKPRADINVQPDPGPRSQACESISFIPWRMFQQIFDCMKCMEVEFYPSYRHRRLHAMCKTGNPLWVYLREFNAVTSSIYSSGKQDSTFLIFTDDVLLPRPVFGAINLAWSLSRAGLGLFLWPIDSGRMLRSGALGTLFSLPELIFINIRKGNFAYIQDMVE